MRNRTYGGVRGRKMKVGGKLLHFPPTRFFYRAILSFGSCRLINWLVPFDRLARATLFSGSGDYIPEVGAFSSQCGNKTFPRWELLFQRRANLLFNNPRLLRNKGTLLFAKGMYCLFLKSLVNILSPNRLNILISLFYIIDFVIC